MKRSLAWPKTLQRPTDAPTTHPDDSQRDQIQALLTALETMFHLTVDYSHRNVELCDTINLLNDRVIAGLWLIDPTASFASTEVTQAVTAVDDLYQKGLDEFNRIERDLYSVGLEREWSQIQGKDSPLDGESIENSD